MTNRTNAFWVGVLFFCFYILGHSDLVCAASGVQVSGDSPVTTNSCTSQKKARNMGKKVASKKTAIPVTGNNNISKTNTGKTRAGKTNTSLASPKAGNLKQTKANTRKNKQAHVRQARLEKTRIKKAQAADKPKKKPYTSKDAGKFARDLFYDAIELQKNLVSWDSLKVASMVFPLFVDSRMMDERLQYCFYDKEHHKNINRIPPVCHDLAQWSISIPIIVLGSQMFWSPDDEMREASRIFLIGLPFVIWTKTLIKKLRFEENLRPWNEAFDSEKRGSGGFPSGHMAEAAYTALLYGMRFGPKFAIPLGSIAAFIGVSFVACNRHYLSQIVAGAGLGAIYALAANKLVDAKVAQNMKFGVKFENKSPAFSISYQF